MKKKLSKLLLSLALLMEAFPATSVALQAAPVTVQSGFAYGIPLQTQSGSFISNPDNPGSNGTNPDGTISYVGNFVSNEALTLSLSEATKASYNLSADSQKWGYWANYFVKAPSSNGVYAQFSIGNSDQRFNLSPYAGMHTNPDIIYDGFDLWYNLADPSQRSDTFDVTFYLASEEALKNNTYYTGQEKDVTYHYTLNFSATYELPEIKMSESYRLTQGTLSYSAQSDTYSMSWNARGPYPQEDEDVQVTLLTLPTGKQVYSSVNGSNLLFSYINQFAVWTIPDLSETTKSSTVSAQWASNNTPALNIAYTLNWNFTDSMEYTMSFEPGGEGVQGLPANQSVAFGTNFTIPSPAPTRPGYVFAGYVVPYHIANYFPGEDFGTVDRDYTFTAAWNPAPAEDISSTVEDGELFVTTNTQANGIISVTTQNEDGAVLGSEITVPAGAVVDNTVQINLGVNTISEEEILVEGNRIDNGQVLNITLPSETEVMIEIPIENASLGTVALQKKSSTSLIPIIESMVSDDTFTFPISASGDYVIKLNSKTFTDVSNSDWFAGPVAFVSSRGIMNGSAGAGSTTFNPGGTLTRAMFAQIIYNMDVPDHPANSSDLWYEDARDYVIEKQMMGVDSEFNPEAPIKREDLVLILWRNAGKPEADESVLDDYDDADSVSDYAKEAVAWGVENKIIGQNSPLKPLYSANRAEIAKMVYAYCVYMNS